MNEEVRYIPSMNATYGKSSARSKEMNEEVRELPTRTANFGYEAPNRNHTELYYPKVSAVSGKDKYHKTAESSSEYTAPEVKEIPSLKNTKPFGRVYSVQTKEHNTEYNAPHPVEIPEVKES